MSDQNLKSHTRWDPIYHFFLAPVVLGTLVFSIKHAMAFPNGMTLWICLLAFAHVLWLFRTRTYALKLQDRLIRLEERTRMERIAPEFAPRFDQLTPRQVVALRFASDGELAELARRALDEKLAPKQIKASIRQWRPDLFRV
jgi:hypothetical protein